MNDFLRSALARWRPLLSFGDSQQYWRDRYRLGGNSGAGSTSVAAQYKANFLNQFVIDQAVNSVIEFGCGDGQQLAIARYPAYVGIDISSDAIRLCRTRFASDPDKRFFVLDDYRSGQADVALSLDVIYHLVEDAIYHQYLSRLFAAGRRFVILYSTDVDSVGRTLPHVRHRNVSEDVKAQFPAFERWSQLESALPEPVEFNGGIATRFLVYRRLVSG